MARFRERSVSPQSGMYRQRQQVMQGAYPAIPVWVDEVSVGPFWVRPGHYQSITDVVVPDFKRRSAAGEIFNNPFSSYNRWASYSGTIYGEYSTGDYPGTSIPFYGYGWNRLENGYFFDHDSAFGQYPDHAPPDLEELKKEAIIKCLGNINKTELNAPVFAAEWQKTKMIHRDVCSAIYKAFLKSAVRGRAMRLSNLWLTIRYGVLPLLSDLSSAAKLLNSSWNPRYTARGFASGSNESSGVYVANVWHGQISFESRIKSDFSVRAGCLYTADETMRMVAQLGLTRPLSVLWETTTLSFVLDWLVDVGAWLDAIQPSGATSILSSWVGEQKDTITTRTIVGIIQNPSIHIRNCIASGIMVDYVREKTRNPNPLSTPVTPALGSGLNQLRSFDAASLLMQKIGYKKR